MELLSLQDGDVLLIGGELRLSVSVLNGIASIAVTRTEQSCCSAVCEPATADACSATCFILMSPKEPPP